MRVSVGDFKLGEEEFDAISSVMRSGRISEGYQTRKFEEEFAQYIGTKYCVVLSSGTAALICGLTALIHDARFPRIKKGAKILASPVTYISTVNAIELSGMQPVFVDIDPRTFTLMPEQVDQALAKDKDIALILPVHLMGFPNDMDALNDIAAKHGVQIFEDTAQAHGSLYKGKKTGTFSIMADYSFYIAHNIQAGEMGALVTNDERLWNMVRKLKTNGRMCDCRECTRSKGICPYKNDDFDPRFTHDIIGYNFKTMDFQPALARVQLKKADWIMKKRQENVSYLNDLLAKHSNRLQLPFYSSDVSYLAYPIVIKDKSLDRKKLMMALEDKGVETRPLFGCIPLHQPAYKHLISVYKSKLPNANRVGLSGFYIGCHQYLGRPEMEYVAKTFDEVLNG